MQNLFTKLKGQIDHISLYEKLLNKESAGQLPWTKSEVSYSFNVIRVQESHIKDHPALSVINDKFKLIPFIFKLPANTCYNWHIDAFRPASINLPLNNHSNSTTCFINETRVNEVNNVTKLEYDPGYFYLFNTQIHHQVLNLNEDRYFFSLTFELPKTQLTYKDILNFCIEQDLLI